jgi:pimeloyl-ACP methyl ester carboxylesterase
LARIVLVHGMNNQYSGPVSMAAAWIPSLRDGLALSGNPHDLPDGDVACVFYGDLFRRSERMLGDSGPIYGPADVEPGFETDLLLEWWAEAARTDPAVIPPDTRTLGAAGVVQKALAALACSRFCAGVAEHLMILWIKQVHRYFTEDEVRARVQQRLADAVGADTRVVVAHSLGSVAAYEALCAHPDWPVRTLVTLGSPLGIRNLIFDRLRPAPANGEGAWPAGLTQWTNIADNADMVALVKKLAPQFGRGVRDIEVDTGLRAHDVRRYLTAAATGRAVGLELAND